MNGWIFIYPHQARTNVYLITLLLSYMRAQQSLTSGRLFSLFSKDPRFNTCLAKIKSQLQKYELSVDGNKDVAENG